MKNYLINNDTVALLKKCDKSIIYTLDDIKVINNNLKFILEYNCNYYGSSLDGRKKCAKSILNVKYRIPIIIDESHNIILLQLNSFRDKECLFLVANKILDMEEINNCLKITCINNQEFYVNLSKSSLEKMLLQSFKLNNTLKSRKITNFV